MPRQSSIKLRCPICKKPTKAADADFPFCSDHCRQIDLGKWATGSYVISSQASDADDLSSTITDDTGDES